VGPFCTEDAKFAAAGPIWQRTADKTTSPPLSVTTVLQKPANNPKSAPRETRCETCGLGAAKNYVDQRHPGFHWPQRWFAEIAGAKSALRLQQQSHKQATISTSDNPPDSERLTTASPFDPDRLRDAREFVERIGDGRVDKARHALEFLSELGSLEGLSSTIDTWSRLLAAVDGDAETAERVLTVLSTAEATPPVTRLRKAA